MAAKRIPDLVSLTGAGSQPSDTLVIFDADMDATRKITRAELAIGILNDLPESVTVGTLGEQDADDVDISGGTIDGVTISNLASDLAVSDGGTGASTAAGARSNLGAAASGANGDITSLTGLTTPLSVAQGGTGGVTPAAARNNLNAAIGGANNDITSLTGLTTPLSASQGGTGVTSLAALATAIGALAVTSQSLVANNGNIQLSNGLTLKWGKYQPGGDLGQTTFAMSFSPAFNAACFGVYPVPIAGGDAWVMVEHDSITTAGWTARVQAAEGGNYIKGWYWIAIGN